MGADEDLAQPESGAGHAWRAKALSALSLGVVAVAAILYVRPSLQPAGAELHAATPPVTRGFQLDAVDFLTPAKGWVLEDLDDLQFVVLGTSDAGRHWKPELAEPSILPGEYMRWFDAEHGVVATVGDEPLVYATQDGGVHWVRHIVYDLYAFAMSASFVDPLHGWELIGAGPDVPVTVPTLVRTVDGGRTWTRAGIEVPAATQPFAVTFTDAQHGWLDTVAPAAVSYATDDGGATWRAVPLPAPSGGWPVPHGSYFVAVRTTPHGGLIASVVDSVPVDGRSGSEVVGYPPLTVRTFDGGAPVVYVYSTFADAPTSAVTAPSGPGPWQAGHQTVMRSADGGRSWTVASPPSADGTIGFAGPLEWWWVGPEAVSTTADGGVSWSPVRTVSVQQPIAGSLVLLDEAHGWIGGVVKGVTLLYATSDGGADWTPVRLPALSL